jgi:hypothetical protein
MFANLSTGCSNPRARSQPAALRRNAKNRKEITTGKRTFHYPRFHSITDGKFADAHREEPPKQGG